MKHIYTTAKIGAVFFVCCMMLLLAPILGVEAGLYIGNLLGH